LKVDGRPGLRTMPCILHARFDRHGSNTGLSAGPSDMARNLDVFSMSSLRSSDMRHAFVASRILPATSRSSRRWRRMRARIGLMALWAALAVWILGEAGAAPSPQAAVQAAVQASPSLPHVDLERAAAWPQESAESWQAPSQESPRDAAPEPSPEEEAALYIAGR
jgi:hypothetical protein